MKYIVMAFLTLTSCNLYAWDGFDYNTSSYIEIDKVNLVRSGQDIEVYNYTTGDYETYEVDSINRYGSSVEIELCDDDTGDCRTIDMD